VTIFAFDDLITPVTREEVTAKVYEVLAIVGVDVTTWKPGAVVRTMLAAAALVLSAFSRLQAAIAKSGFLYFAEEEWLEVVAYYVYGVAKNKADFAKGEITLVNAGGGVYAADPGDVIFRNPDTGKSYRNTTSWTLGALATLTVPIQAIEAGSASTSLAGAITTLETPLLGVTCSNALAVVGHDDETDPDLRTRCGEKLGSLSPNGPWDAYAFAARNATRADGGNVGVTRVRSRNDGAGGVTTYVASATGAVLGSVSDPASDLGIVDEAIQQIAAPLAVTAVTESAAVKVINVAYELWAYNSSGLTDAQLSTAVGAKLADFVRTQPIGGNIVDPDTGRIYRSAIAAVIGATVPAIFRVNVTSPATDPELAFNEVGALGTVTGTIHQVTPAEGF